MIYETSLTGIKVFASHGVYEAERIIGMEFIVDASVKQHMKDDEVITTLAHAINYEKIYKIILEQMMVTEYLIETVAQRILNQLKNEFSQAQQIKVTIHKPNAGGFMHSGEAVVMFTFEQ